VRRRADWLAARAAAQTIRARLATMAFCSIPLRWYGVFALGLVCLCDFASGASPASEQYVTVPGCRIMFADEVQLASERQGILAEIAPPGARVAAGADVGRLRDTLLKASLAIAEREADNDIEVRFALKAAELAQLKHERALLANQQVVGTVSELELKELHLAADRAVLQHEQAEHRLAVARLHLDEMRASCESLHMVAPFAAHVVAVYKKPGEVVQQGELVAEVVNTEKIRVEGAVNLSDLSFVTPQVKIHLKVDAPASLGLAEQVFTGAITFVDVKVEPVSQTVRIAAEVDNSSGLLREGLKGVMFIPKQAADARQGQ
jgi:multidrug efflux pump subunit AcrA (membrane-fusion protein)